MPTFCKVDPAIGATEEITRINDLLGKRALAQRAVEEDDGQQKQNR